MKTTCMMILLVFGLAMVPRYAGADTEDRNLPVFTGISLRIPATLYIEQGSERKVTIEAKTSTLEEIITEINDRTLVIRFPARNFFVRDFDPGKITIRITIPEITDLSVSGSGDILGAKPISTLIMDLNVSGSGNIDLTMLDAERVKTNISGSGNILIRGEKPAANLTGTISGSGNIKAEGFEAQEVKMTIAGSGNCYVRSNGNITVKIAGSGNLYYTGNPNVDSTIAGSGSVKEIR